MTTAPPSLRTPPAWAAHQRTCSGALGPIDLRETLFDQTGQSLLGEMGLWTCAHCEASAFLLVRSFAEDPLPEARASGDGSHEAAYGGKVVIRRRYEGAVFSPVDQSNPNWTGRTSASRILF